MVVLLILVLSCLIFRGLGFAGVPAFATWQASARDALSLMLVFTGISHFTFHEGRFRPHDSAFDSVAACDGVFHRSL